VKNERVIAMNYQLKDGIVENDHYGVFVLEVNVLLTYFRNSIS
jgi:hypothetical protein